MSGKPGAPDKSSIKASATVTFYEGRFASTEWKFPKPLEEQEKVTTRLELTCYHLTKMLWNLGRENETTAELLADVLGIGKSLVTNYSDRSKIMERFPQRVEPRKGQGKKITSYLYAAGEKTAIWADMDSKLLDKEIAASALLLLEDIVFDERTAPPGLVFIGGVLSKVVEEITENFKIWFDDPSNIISTPLSAIRKTFKEMA